MSIQVVSIGGVSLLQDLLSEDNVSFRYPAETWEDVIRHGGQLMVDAGFTDPTDTGSFSGLPKSIGFSNVTKAAPTCLAPISGRA